MSAGWWEYSDHTGNKKPRASEAQGFRSDFYVFCFRKASQRLLGWKRYFLGFWLVLVPIVADWVVPTGLPVASTGVFDVAAGWPAVLDRLGAMLPELLCMVLLVEVADLVAVPAGRLPMVALPVGVV